MVSGEQNAQMLAFHENNQEFFMSFFSKLAESGQKKLGELEDHRYRASCMSDQELLRAARFNSGLAKAAYLQEVKNRGLEAEFRKMMNS